MTTVTTVEWSTKRVAVGEDGGFTRVAWCSSDVVDNGGAEKDGQATAAAMVDDGNDGAATIWSTSRQSHGAAAAAVGALAAAVART